VRRGDERRALRDERQTGSGRLVDVRVEQDRLIAVTLPTQELEQARGVRPLRREPRTLVGKRVRLGQHVPLVILERRAAQARDRKAPDPHRSVQRLAAREVRRPRPVVKGRGRRYLDLVYLREALRHDARVRLGPADDLGPVTLDDDEDGHETPER
jgi:hypothetical protein